MPDNDLERELRELGQNVEYPQTPDIAHSVRRRLDENTELPARGGLLRLPALFPRLAIAAAFLLVIAIPMLSPTAREMASGLFASVKGREAVQAAGGVSGNAGNQAGGGKVEQAGNVPTSANEGSAKVKTERDPEKTMQLGKELSLGQAQARIEGQILLPHTQKLGNPDEIYASGSRNKNTLSFVYHPRPGLPAMGNSGIGLLLTQFLNRPESLYKAEGTPKVPSSERISVGSRQAYWFPNGKVLGSQPGNSRNLLGGALLWETEGHAMLLRANVSEEIAIRIANSVD